jgi:DNA integrity scanning protein DisA with diadenylate cyclase activity
VRAHALAAFNTQPHNTWMDGDGTRHKLRMPHLSGLLNAFASLISHLISLIFWDLCQIENSVKMSNVTIVKKTFINYCCLLANTNFSGQNISSFIHYFLTCNMIDSIHSIDCLVNALLAYVYLTKPWRRESRQFNSLPFISHCTETLKVLI